MVNEFSVSIREMQEKYQVLEFQQMKCSVIFDLSCNLAKVLEFYTREIPQAFLSGTETNLRRLTELMSLFSTTLPQLQMLSFLICEFPCWSLRRHCHSPEKVNRGMILAPLVGIISNLLDARVGMECGQQNDVVGVFASMDCPDAVHCGFQYLLEYNWTMSSRGDAYSGKLQQLESFLSLLVSRIFKVS